MDKCRGRGESLTAAAGKWTLLGQRTGVVTGDDRLMRDCTYIDSTGRMITTRIDANDLCPPTPFQRRGPYA